MADDDKKTFMEWQDEAGEDAREALDNMGDDKKQE